MKRFVQVLSLFFFSAVYAASFPNHVIGQDSKIQVLLHQLQTAKNDTERRDISAQLRAIGPKTLEDGIAVQEALKSKPFDLYVYTEAVALVDRMRDKRYDDILINILIDEKPYWLKADIPKLTAAEDPEYARRGIALMYAMNILGLHKCANATPILKEYLLFKGPDDFASNALAAIGDKAPSQER